MISHPINRVQAIKSKFENLNSESAPTKQYSQLYKLRNECERKENKENTCEIRHDKYGDRASEIETDSSDDYTVKPNASALYKNDVKRSVSDSKATLTRQSSDPGKKLHRSHAFRCDRSQKINSPKRHGSCNGRSETSEFLKMERKLSRDRLKRLGNVLEQQMKKENFVPFKLESDEVIVGVVKEVSPFNSVPDEKVPPHILAQYAQVIKPKKRDDKQDVMTDSGVSSETENLEEEKNGCTKKVSPETEILEDENGGRVKKIMSQFESIEKTEPESVEPVPIEPIPLDLKTNLDIMEDLAGSSETMKLERKNPHIKITDTLKKALKQPLPPGPPPKKPPRKFLPPEMVEKEKSDTKRKLEKLEQVLMKREARKENNIYDIAEENLSLKRPKEVHYLCTEILDITQRTLLPNQNESPLKNCFNKLNCAVTYNSMSSLPYTRLSAGLDSNRNSLKNDCSCSQDGLNKEMSPLRTFMSEKCSKCHINDEKCGFKCHLSCKCRAEKSEFFLDEHIYDEPHLSGDEAKARSDKKNRYGTLNGVKLNSAFSKSLEDLRGKETKEDTAIYEIPSDLHPTTPDTPNTPNTPKIDFQKLRENFENGSMSNQTQPNGSNQPIQPNKSSSLMNQNQPNATNQPILPNKSTSLMKAARSIENIFEDGKFKKKSPERKFATEVRRYKPREAVGFSFAKKNPQLDVDRENLSRLMNEIYETVTAACIMEENKPGSFPTDQSDGSTSEESVKLTRSLTEKRKNYVRRVSSRLAYLEPKNIKQTRYRHQTSICSYKSETLDNPYSTFRSWKSFRTSQNNLTNKMDTDSKFNLTDSSGNILSIKNDYDSDVSIDNLSIDEKTGCVDIELPFEPRENGLFNVCLLVGLNYMTGEAYVKSVFPAQVQVPQHIENLIFPETMSQDKGEWSADSKSTQCYSFVLTDERGERSYGYCRRVLPEGATSCLPLCYCLIGKYRAPGFYYKVLQELESHHGSSEEQIHSILQHLFELDFPNPGEEITLTTKHVYKTQTSSSSDLLSLKDSLLSDLSKHIINSRKNSINSDSSGSKNASRRNSKDSSKNSNDSGKNSNDSGKNTNDSAKNSNDSAKNLDESSRCVKELKSQFSVPDVPSSKSCSENNVKCKTMPVIRRSEGESEFYLSSDYYDYENNNGPARVLLNLDSPRTKSIKQPLDPRAEEVSASQLLDSLGAGLLIKVFGSLLLERKIIIRADRLSVVSSRLEALQASLYPFVWQQPLISLVPAEIQQELLHAPLPMLAGMLRGGGEMDLGGVAFEEGMLIDLSHPTKVLFYQGDESTILPTTSYKTLKTSLQMESIKNKDKSDTKTRNVMISEAFLRFFVDILGDFWKYFRFGVLKDGDLGRGNVVFDKEAFIKNATSKQNQCFLEWFTETAMFNHFIQNMAMRYRETYSQESPRPDSKKDSRTQDSRTQDSRTQDSSDSLDSQYKLIDCPTPNFYQLFEERILSRRNSKAVDRSGYKNALNKRVKLLKSRLKDLVG